MFDILYNFELNMKTIILPSILFLFILLFTSCKTFKKDCNDCPNFGTNSVKNSEMNS